MESGILCADSVREDEALLRSGRPAVRVAVLGDQALSVGAGTSRVAGCLARAAAEGIPVVRRSSGGTGVLHAIGDLAWSIVLPRAHPLVGRDFVRSYDRLGQGTTRFATTLGLAAVWEAAPGLSEDCCLLGGRGQILSVGGKILGGAAQHVTGRALLHHGILPYRIDRKAQCRVFALESPGPGDRLTDLRELGVTAPLERLARALAEAIARDVSDESRGRSG